MNESDAKKEHFIEGENVSLLRKKNQIFIHTIVNSVWLL